VFCEAYMNNKDMNNKDTNKEDATQKIVPRFNILFVLTGLIVFLPLAVTCYALLQLYWHGIGWLEVGLLAGMYAITLFGVDVGYHRYFSHRSFKTNRYFESLLAILGMMSAQGGLWYWVMDHPRHHKVSDRPGDMHSPHLSGPGFWNGLRGIYHSHIGWVFKVSDAAAIATPEMKAEFKRKLHNPFLLKLARMQLWWILAGLLVPGVIGGVITQSWSGFVNGVIWGGFVRIFLVQQIMGFVNSLCHLTGTRPFKTHEGDRSTNVAWLAIPSLGQSWHHNHHAFPSSATFKIDWWHIDIDGHILWVLEKMGLVWDVRKPSSELVASKRVLVG
jgi:stearoyl-CoA desaturase (Delta-9 desaturase)